MVEKYPNYDKYDHRAEFNINPKLMAFSKKELHERYNEIRKSSPPNTSQLDLIIELIEDNNARLYNMFIDHYHT